jgi:hypothetical protein
MARSFIVEGSRFYMPRRYQGPDDVLLLTHITGEPIAFQPNEVSCFELLALPHTLRHFVVLYVGNKSYVLLETKEEVIATLDGGTRAESSVRGMPAVSGRLSAEQNPL